MTSNYSHKCREFLKIFVCWFIIFSLFLFLSVVKQVSFWIGKLNRLVCVTFLISMDSPFPYRCVDPPSQVKWNRVAFLLSILYDGNYFLITFKTRVFYPRYKVHLGIERSLIQERFYQLIILTGLLSISEMAMRELFYEGLMIFGRNGGLHYDLLEIFNCW